MNKFTLFLLIAFLFTWNAKAQVQIGDLYYNLNDDNLTAETAATPTQDPANGITASGYTLATITIPATVSYNGNTYNVVKIGDGSMRENPNLLNVTLSSPNCTTIGNSAFASCTSLIMVAYSQYASVVEDWAFYGCSSLSAFVFSPNLTRIPTHCFQQCGLTSVTIPAGVTVIDVCAFQDCSKLALADIPAGVTTIGGWAFYGIAIKSATIPGGVQAITNEAFRYCNNLTSVTFLDGVQEIDGWTFADCPLLRTMTIPASMTTMQDWACDKDSITDVYVAWPTPPDPDVDNIKMWTFGNTDRSGGVCYVPEQYRSAYGDTWFDFPVQSYILTGIATLAPETARAYYADGTLSLFGLNNYAVSVYSANGQLVSAFKAETTNVSLPLAPGVYILKAANGQTTKAIKFIAK